MASATREAFSFLALLYHSSCLIFGLESSALKKYACSKPAHTAPRTDPSNGFGSPPLLAGLRFVAPNLPPSLSGRPLLAERCTPQRVSIQSPHAAISLKFSD